MLDDEQFCEKWGDIYDGLVLSKDAEKRRAAIFYPFWFCMRRLIFCFTCIMAQDNLLIQIMLAIFCAIVNLCYLWVY